MKVLYLIFTFDLILIKKGRHKTLYINNSNSNEMLALGNATNENMKEYLMNKLLILVFIYTIQTIKKKECVVYFSYNNKKKKKMKNVHYKRKHMTFFEAFLPATGCFQ